MHIAKLVSGSIVVGICVLSSVAHAEGDMVSTDARLTAAPPQPKRGSS